MTDPLQRYNIDNSQLYVERKEDAMNNWGVIANAVLKNNVQK